MNTQNQIPDRKRRSDSVFSQLTPEQHTQLRDWLGRFSYEKVQELVAQPAPKGFGINTHTNSLYRYFHEEIPEQLLTQRTTLLAPMKEAAFLIKTEPGPYRVVAVEMLEQKLLRMALSPEGQMPQLTSLFKLLLKNQDQAFKEQQAAFKSARQTNGTVMDASTAEQKQLAPSEPPVVPPTPLENLNVPVETPPPAPAQ